MRAKGRSQAGRRGGRPFGFNFERMVFALALQRLVEPTPGSDLAGSKWIATVHEPGFENLRLPNFYQALGFLWKHKNEIEEGLYRRGLDLFNQELDLVFFDTTSTYFEGTGGAALKGLAKRGKSKDHRPDHLQVVIGVVMRPDGIPIACEVWPGNTSDMRTLVPVVEALRKRFRIRRVVFVCDRGMVSEENLAKIEKEAGYRYIVGVKMRGLVEVRDEVLSRAGRYADVNDSLQVKEVWIEDELTPRQKRRYVVCFNPDEAKKDRADREAIVNKLKKKLGSGPGGIKRLLNNRGYKRFLKIRDGSAAQVDLDKVLEDSRYDGKYVLRTTVSDADLSAAEIALAYKQLTWIERLWRELKDVVRVRPIYHHLHKQNVKGHIFACFLALYLSAYLKQKLRQADPDWHVQWDELIRDLSRLRAVEVELQNQRYLLRTPAVGSTGRLFSLLGAKLPPAAQAL